MSHAEPLPPFVHTVRVYWEDTDAGGVVFYANYLKFFERARTEWLRAHGFEQQRLRETEGAVFVVTETTVRYRQPARLDDLIDVSCVVRSAGRASITFEQQAVRATTARDGLLLAEGEIRIGCVDVGTFRPRRMPNALLDLLP